MPPCPSGALWAAAPRGWAPRPHGHSASCWAFFPGCPVDASTASWRQSPPDWWEQMVCLELITSAKASVGHLQRESKSLTSTASGVLPSDPRAASARPGGKGRAPLDWWPSMACWASQGREAERPGCSVWVSGVGEDAPPGEQDCIWAPQRPFPL